MYMAIKNLFKPTELKREELEVPEIKIPQKEREAESKKELLEKAQEKRKREKPEKKPISPEKPSIQPPAATPQPPAKLQTLEKSQVLIEIEYILEQDLKDAYFKMDEQQREKFKTEGEKIASRIEEHLQQTKIKVKKIFKLILDWLKIIPSVNKFFIRQESKIKTDKILKLKQK